MMTESAVRDARSAELVGARPTSVSTTVEDLATRVSGLDEAFSRLAERISPILVAPGQDTYPAEMIVREERSSGMRDNLAETADRIAMLIRRVNETADRIDL